MKEQSADVDISSLKKDIEQLRQDMAQITSSLFQEKQDSAKRFTEGLIEGLVKQSHNLVENARSTGENTLRSVTGSSQRAVHQVETKISQRPFLSMLLSFISGLVIAEILEASNRSTENSNS